MGTKGLSSRFKARKIIRVLVADRTRMNCQMLGASLQAVNANCKVVGCAVNTAEMRQILVEQKPKISVISPDLEDGPLAGLDMVQEIRCSFPETRPIILLDSTGPRMILDSFRAGAKGVFSRDKSIETLWRCIEVVNEGQIWASTIEIQVVLQALAEQARSKPLCLQGSKTLTTREAEIVGLVGEGLRNRGISQRLSISPHTVKNNLYRVYAKLGISNRVELVARMGTSGMTAPRAVSVARQERLAG